MVEAAEPGSPAPCAADEATAAGDVAVGSGAWTAVHHAFTSPQDVESFDSDPGNALA